MPDHPKRPVINRSPSRFLEHGGTVAGVVGLLVLGHLQGSEIQTLTLDLLVVTVRFVVLEALSAMAVFTFFVGFTGLLLVREVWKSRESFEPITTGPPLTAIVPVCRDHAVMDTSVESLVAWRDTRDGRIDGLGWGLLCAPLLYPAFGVLTLRSLLEYCCSWDGSWYRVEKTGA